MKEKYYKNDTIEIWLDNGILHVKYEPVFITLDMAKKNVAERLKRYEGKTYPMFVDVRNTKSGSSETKEYLSGEEATHGISAGAFLVSSHFEVWAINLWLSIFPVSIPTKLFRNRRKALKWLEQYK